MLKKTIPLIITFIGGTLMILQYFLPSLSNIGTYATIYFNMLIGFAYILGAFSLLKVNGEKILKQKPDWQYNLVLLLGLAATVITGLFGHLLWPSYAGHNPTEEGTAFFWIFEYILTPLAATMFSLLVFFIASASYRAFKAKSTEATLLLGTALFVMLFRIPIGEALWSFCGLDQVITLNNMLENIIMGGFNVAGQRAIQIAAGIGLVSISLKIILGIERSYLGGE